MSPWWPLFELLSWCLIFTSNHWNSFVDQGIRRWNIRVPHLQMSCRLYSMTGYQDSKSRLWPPGNMPHLRDYPYMIHIICVRIMSWVLHIMGLTHWPLADAFIFFFFKNILMIHLLHSFCKTVISEYHRMPLMTSQHWFRKWLGAVRHQAIT